LGQEGSTRRSKFSLWLMRFCHWRMLVTFQLQAVGVPKR